MYVITVVSDISDSSVYGPFKTKAKAQELIDMLSEDFYSRGDAFFNINEVNTIDSFKNDFDVVEVAPVPVTEELFLKKYGRVENSYILKNLYSMPKGYFEQFVSPKNPFGTANFAQEKREFFRNNVESVVREIIVSEDILKDLFDAEYHDEIRSLLGWVKD